MSTGANSSPKPSSQVPSYHGNSKRPGHPMGTQSVKETTLPSPKKGS